MAARLRVHLGSLSLPCVNNLLKLSLQKQEIGLKLLVAVGTSLCTIDICIVEDHDVRDPDIQ